MRTISLNSSSACIVTKSTKSAMPYVYVGKRNFYIGKTLWEIVGNLRNFGVGRILVRSKFERYPEVTYFRIVRADPLMDEKNLFGRVWVDKVFRGKPSSEVVDLSKVAYKNDFKLIPKDEEDYYIKNTLPAAEVDSNLKTLPEFLQFPPLLRAMLQSKQQGEEPLLKAVYVEGEANKFKLESGQVCRKSITEGTFAPHLYSNINTE